MIEHRQARRVLLAVPALAALIVSGCRVGPAYKRPDLAPPSAYRGAAAAATAESLADLPWWQVFDDPALQPDARHRFPLFKRIVRPGVDNLFFMGLAQASPTIVNLAEQQSKLVAGILAGTYALPSVSEMHRIVEADEAASLAQYYQAPRHTIQVDFARYVRDLTKEIDAGRKRVRASAVVAG